MRRVIWPFIIWLLALALPAQGLAAATMLHCAPQRSAAVQSVHAAHEHHGAAPHDAAHAQHHHGTAAVDHDAAATDDEASMVNPALQKCSACAICCIGMALPSAVQVLPAPIAVATVRPEPASVHTAFLTSGPERPPRALRA